jgi:zinc protease
VRTARSRTLILETLLALVLGATLGAGAVSAQEIPARPDQLTFKPLVYTPPVAKDYRVVLKNGMVVFIAEDRALPLVNIAITLRAGSWLDPLGKEGLASFTGSQLRQGGTRSLSAEELDEKLDFLAAHVSSGIGTSSGMASLNCLADNLDESLRIFVEMLREPRFQQDRLALAKQQALQEMSKRNDDSADIEAREWGVLVYGKDQFTNRFTTAASVDSITRDDMLAFQRRWIHPTNMIAAVSGAFDRAEMLRRLERAFSGWQGKAPRVPPVPATIQPAPPGLYRIQKDVNQGRVSIGLPSVRQDSPDVYALEVMNEILGGSGFSSRITEVVRSNEGLAYSAGSALSFGAFYPGRFRAYFQSKSRTVAWAADLVLQQIRRIRDQEVGQGELETIKSGLVQSFPSNFGSKAQAMAIFASDEYTGRDPSYWTRYRDRIAAVTAKDVQRVARQYLVPEKMIMLCVGDQKQIDRGDGQHDVNLVSLAPGSRVETLPLRDPMTMKPR